jgi:hypothetical protein
MPPTPYIEKSDSNLIGGAPASHFLVDDNNYRGN